MKPLIHRPLCTRLLALAVLGRCLLAVPLFAQTAPPVTNGDDALRPIAYLNGVTQETLSAETAELARNINALIDELKRNGFPEQSLTGLKQLVDQLGTLGGEDMAVIADRLRGLGDDPGQNAREAVTGAYVAQQAVEARLKALAKKIAVRQLREEAVRRLETLIARQLSTQRETRSIAESGPTSSRQQLLATDQRGIGEDLEAFFQTGETLLSNLRDSTVSGANTTTDNAGPSFTDRVNGTLLNTYASEALERIQSSNYIEAYGRQNLLLAELNRILQGILSSQTKEERLASALMQVSALRQQQEARDQSDKKSDTDKQAEAEKAQAAADAAKLLKAKIASVDKDAAKALDEAQKALQKEADKAAQAAEDAAKTAQNKTPEANAPDAAKAAQEAAAQTAQNKADQAKGQDDAKTAAQEKPSAADIAAQQQQPATSEASENQAGQQNASEQGQQMASDEAGAKPQGDESGAKPDGEKGQGEQPAGQKAPPSEASTALAAAEAALRQQLAAEQARETAASQQANGQKQSGQNQPNQQGQNQQGQNKQAQNQQGQNQANYSSEGGAGLGMVANQSVTGEEGSAQTVGALKREEREAMASLQNERYPAEYAPWVQQYWRNLAQEK